MRRFKQALPYEECEEILRGEPRGVLSVLGENGYPYGFPMDFVYEDGKLYFHCAKVGHKLDALRACDRVSFCVMDQGYRKEGDWALNIRSVIIFGRIRFIEDPEETIERVRHLGLKYYPTRESVEEEIRQAGARVQILELTIDHMTGKLVNES
ncbi:MAG: pyridoxamine 5'-phosphate oxidase family protein [Lachnospiraceae bacterium]|nr:pyridoxamine 5'-phosphate oxidase family protein [Lachnospiraceae bacterium]